MASYLPWFMKERIDDIRNRLNLRYKNEGLAHVLGDLYGQPSIEDKEFPPRTTFNLIPALHHLSGTMAFTFECSHGSTSERFPEPFVDHGDIVDIQLNLYEEILDYVIENRLYWE